MHRTERLFFIALGLWLVTALVASYAASSSPLFGLLLAGAAGTAAGFLGARRVDPHRTRVRVGRKRRRHRTEEQRAADALLGKPEET